MKLFLVINLFIFYVICSQQEQPNEENRKWYFDPETINAYIKEKIDSCPQLKADPHKRETRSWDDLSDFGKVCFVGVITFFVFIIIKILKCIFRRK
jgi:hypothetical protein